MIHGKPGGIQVSVFDYEAAARDRLPKSAFDYYDSGAHDEITLRENRAAFDRICLYYRVLRDISSRETSVLLLGAPAAFPLVIAPTAFHRLACDEGEVATAAAAGTAGVPMILSTLSTRSIEAVTGTASGPVWFQLYVYRDRGETAALVRRAERAGCEALVLTVDAQLWGVRERDVRNRFQLPPDLEMPNLAADSRRMADTGGSALAAYVAEKFDPALSWDDLAWLVGVTELPVLVKGIVHPEDGRRAVETGAAGVIVSNHGGRQLDTAPATIDALPAVAEAAHRAAEARVAPLVLVDGGVRRGTDIVKAIVRGADAVCVGRPVLWGLAVDGSDGAVGVLKLLHREFDTALGLCGASHPLELRELDLFHPATE